MNAFVLFTLYAIVMDEFLELGFVPPTSSLNYLPHCAVVISDAHAKFEIPRALVRLRLITFTVKNFVQLLLYRQIHSIQKFNSFDFCIVNSLAIHFGHCDLKILKQAQQQVLISFKLLFE